MHALPLSLARFLALGATTLAASAALAAGQVHAVQAAPSSAPSAAQRAAAAAPNPAGLRPPLPAGLTDGSGAAVATDPVAANNTITRAPATTGSNGTTAGGPVFNPGSMPTDTATAQPATTILGAGATVPGPSQSINAGAGGYNAVDLARSFYMADANHDGELTSAEFNRLTIRPLGFQQMDRDFDGVISRFEFQDATE
jgi:hypothetical protein